MRSNTSFLTRLRSILLLILALTMILTAVACNTDSNKDKNPPQNNDNTDNSDNGETNNPDDNDKDNNDNKEDELPVINVASIAEYVEKLASTVYSANLVPDKAYGLSDSKVGINQKRFETEILYPFPADSEFKKIIKLADKGFSSKNTDAQNSSIISDALTELKSVSGNKMLVFPKGEFKIAETITISGFKDLYVRGEGTKLYITDWITVFALKNSENTHISDITFTYDESPIVTGNVTAYDAATNSVTVSVNRDFDIASSKYSSMIVHGYYDLDYNEAEGKYEVAAEKNARYGTDKDSMKIVNLPQNKIAVFFNKNNELTRTPEAGDKVAIALSNYNNGAWGMNTSSCVNTYYENVTIQSVPAMAFRVGQSENLYANRLYIVPDTSRDIYLATTADGIHTTALSGEFILTNSRIESVQDDGLNVNTRWDTVDSFSGSTLKITPHTSTDIKIVAGSVIEIYDPDNCAFYGQYKVVSRNGNTLVLDKELDKSIKKGCLVGNTSSATKLTIDNCLFTNFYSRGCLIQCRDSKIINTTFKNISLSAIRVLFIRDEFHEAITPNNVVIENNKFIKTNASHKMFCDVEVLAAHRAGETTIGTMKNIHLRNNFFAHTGGTGIVFYGTSESSATNNLMYNINSIPNYRNLGKACTDAGFACYMSKDITISKNYIYMTNPTATFEDVKVTACENITDSKNTYKAIRN